MKKIDFLLSGRIATIVGAERGMCHTNVPLAFLRARAELPDQIEYVEGLWRVDGQVVFHAWIETDDFIIDPTLAVTSMPSLHKQHFPIYRYSENGFLQRLDKDGFKVGSKRDLWLSWDDPKVVELYREIDFPDSS
jgi:hypothetical protein